MAKLISWLFGKKEYLYFNEYYRIDNPDNRIFSKLHSSKEEANEYAFNFFNTIFVKTHKTIKP